MKKIYKELHIEITTDEIIKGENRNDWNYQLVCKDHSVTKEHRIGKLYRSRAAASRAANKIAKKVIHWYPI